MKNSMTWRLLIALILICIPVALRSSAMANEDKEYPITVDGGHAELGFAEGSVPAQVAHLPAEEDDAGQGTGTCPKFEN